MLNKGKKGVSGVVTVVILVALVLVAIGVVWGVVSNLLEEQTGSINVESACMELDIDITNGNCNAAECNTTVMRRAGGDQMDGYYLVYYDQDGATDSYAVEVDLGQLSSDTYTFSSFNAITDGTEVTKIEATPFVVDSKGDRHICKNSATYSP